MDQFRAEISILQQLDHPHILKLYEYFESDKNFYLITELCTGGELFDKIIEKEFFTEMEAAHVFKQFMMGINYCHKVGIVHRDLKPENFLYETKEETSDIKIIDFGLSKVFQKGKNGISKMETKAGTVSAIYRHNHFVTSFSHTTSHLRSLPETTTRSVISGLLVAFSTLCCVVTQHSAEMTTRRSYSLLSRVSTPLTARNGKIFQRKPKT